MSTLSSIYNLLQCLSHFIKYSILIYIHLNRNSGAIHSMQEKTTTNQQNLPLVVGVDLGGTHIRTAVLQGPKLHSRVSLLTGENPTPERLLPRVYGAIQQALDEAHITLDQIAGIGVATPGPLNNRTGVIYSPHNLPGWDNVPLRDLIQQHFNTLILIENDAHTAGLGEYMFGAGQGSRYMVYLTISTGIGGGIIIDGKILEGANGTAGELGHMTIDWKGERCNCGNVGCLEYLASGTAIARYANEAITAGQGGDLMRMGRMLMEPALRIVQERAMKAPRDSARIALAQLTRNAGLVGAGALIYSNAQNT